MTQAEMAAMLRSMDRKVDRLCKAIEGNGTPERGLLWRMASVERGNALWRKAALLFAGGFLSAAGLWTFDKLTAPAQAGQVEREAAP